MIKIWQKMLASRFPEVQVINGNAADLEKLLGDKVGSISSVISGLPLRSLPNTVAMNILKQIPNTLISGGRYIQFTYDFKRKNDYCPDLATLTHSKKVWLNVPPAKVDVFTR
ncbi:hypothetical protein [Piscirickettsia litoralis]|uniref:hypothetical protein n=1 Tax=Piscirickettsia litoralis TaxID=1891921 RepID=UPI001F30AD70|nr:hypothetical protein [Piscirickettsia litoralis]